MGARRARARRADGSGPTCGRCASATRSGLDAARPEAVAQRRERGRRTARENLAELVDAGTFVEYGPLLFAAQERRRSREELIARTPADGLVAGVGEVDGPAVRGDVLRLHRSGGHAGHAKPPKKDRLFEIAERRRLPVVLFAEGGGGRPGDVDMPIVAGLDCRAFALFARLSGLVPLMGIASGYCFAGQRRAARLLRRGDRHRGLEHRHGRPGDDRGRRARRARPGEVGPIDVQDANGVVDLRAADDARRSPAPSATSPTSAARATSRQRVQREVPDQRLLRELVPEQRKRVYDVRRVVEALFDEGSVLELRRGFAAGIVTALARVEGRPLGVVANDPTHLGGAIDGDGADKAARFMRLCDAFEPAGAVPVRHARLHGRPRRRATATVRHFARMFLAGANLTRAFGTIVLRKGYGLGAQAMAGGGFKAPLFTVAWPTSEFGAMGLEGAVAWACAGS